MDNAKNIKNRTFTVQISGGVITYEVSELLKQSEIAKQLLEKYKGNYDGLIAENSEVLDRKKLFAIYCMCEKGMNIFKNNFDNGKSFLLLSARLGLADAQYSYGHVMKSVSTDESSIWFKRAADQGHLAACNVYAGLLLKDNLNETKEYLEKAVFLTDYPPDEAVLNLATIYLSPNLAKEFFALRFMANYMVLRVLNSERPNIRERAEVLLKQHHPYVITNDSKLEWEKAFNLFKENWRNNQIQKNNNNNNNNNYSPTKTIESHEKELEFLSNIIGKKHPNPKWKVTRDENEKYNAALLGAFVSKDEIELLQTLLLNYKISSYVLSKTDTSPVQEKHYSYILVVEDIFAQVKQASKEPMAMKEVFVFVIKEGNKPVTAKITGSKVEKYAYAIDLAMRYLESNPEHFFDAAVMFRKMLLKISPDFKTIFGKVSIIDVDSHEKLLAIFKKVIPPEASYSIEKKYLLLDRKEQTSSEKQFANY